MDSVRQQKVSALIKRELATIFLDVAKSKLGGAFITVTQVRVTSDMSLARVYLSLFVKGEKEELLNQVKEIKGYIRGVLGKRLAKDLRKIPDLQFYIDDSLDYAAEIDRLLK
ncbi:30S ribosome-binding factor RbfA [Luteibaculum oceani]|uniref:Ribosome-binding factor A n=1 Tax=Luteibaculum oceani TaxID=1294296 RepID=A0A5C6V2R9_9FLAO|nr:30S ribosome-binding factor RbfA [Luteibaculum oceani]TXC78961.1 30S ribosome-binding factor RbfA [Luteibaculum oceani]